MILGQIIEYSGRELHLFQSSCYQAFRRSLQNQCPASMICHLFSNPEQLIGFGSREIPVGIKDFTGV